MLPLQGKKIIVTRARQQAEEFSQKLTEAGAQVLEFPVLDFVLPSNLAPLQQALLNLAQYHWLIFTSANGVNFFGQQAEQAGIKFPADLKIAVTGTATAKALQKWGFEPTLIATNFSAEGLLADLPDMAGKQVLVPQAGIARDTLVTGLRERGAVVQPVVAYRTVMGQEQPHDPVNARQLANWLAHGDINMLTFASPSAVQFFARRIATVSSTPLPNLLNTTLIAAMGDLTAEAVRQAGLAVALQPEVATTNAMCEQIVNFYKNQLTGITKQ